MTVNRNNLPVIFLAFANDRENYLNNLTLEQRNIRSALESAEKAGLCEVVYETDVTLEGIFDVFQKYRDRIALFHYGGHAEDYKMLLETHAGGNTAVSSTGLSNFLASQHGLQLVFVNGCSSQSQALELIDAGVPAVVGTLQPIDDGVATDLSTRFYKGLAAGESIDRSWNAAVEQVKSMKGKEGYRSFVLDKRPETITAFPWNLHYREGAETVKNWNLPAAAKSHLFGLPEIQARYYRNLPESPFIGLNYFKKEYAGIFFGRGAQIRELYNKLTGIHPIMLFYGNSGTGKSSLLDAGLLPRIEDQYEVQYIRRDQLKGLNRSLIDGLKRIGGYSGEEEAGLPGEEARQKKIAELKAAIQSGSESVRKILELELEKLEAAGDEKLAAPHLWHQIEKKSGKPLLIVLDQVEEAFTRGLPSGAETELAELLDSIDHVFGPHATEPRGRLILAYRKEFHPEIRDGFQKRMLPFAEVYLKHLDRESIIEAVEGITKHPYTQDKYRLSIEPNLPEIMADDLLEDRDSPVAPMLQIVLTKLWNAAVKKNPDNPSFTHDSYLEIKKEGVAMGEFFAQQMDQLRKWKPDVVDSGLVLDVLHAHTTAQGTSGIQRLEQIRAHYQHRQDIIDQLIEKCKELYLLTLSHEERGATSLAHDTLAPIVIHRFNESDYPGQRAIRILNNKLRDFEHNQKDVFLSEADLKIVEEGLNGMQRLQEQGHKLIRVSREMQARREKERKRNRTIIRALGVLIVLFGVFAAYQWVAAVNAGRTAVTRAREAREAEQAAKAALAVAEEEKQKAEQARSEANDNLIRSTWQSGVYLKERSEIGGDNDEGGAFTAIDGLRAMYSFFKPVIDINKMQGISPVPIFLDGPHLQGDKVEFELNSADFGRYNPEFFVWGKEHLVPASEDNFFRRLTQPIYDEILLDQARVYYDTYLFLEKSVDKNKIEDVKTAYLQEIGKYSKEDKLGGFREGPGEILNVFGERTYAYRHAQDRFVKPELIEYTASVAPGFWVRRDIDGSKEAAFQLLEKLVNTYDQSFAGEMKRVYGN